METDGGGWTVFQRRKYGNVDFYRDWASYEHGFGYLFEDYWMGLSKIHRLANSNAPQVLRVDLKDCAGNPAYAKYSSFYIGDSSTDYTLHVTGYSGTAGNGLVFSHEQKFTTKDKNNSRSSSNCANVFNDAWWFNLCDWPSLNGIYSIGTSVVYKGVPWYSWNDGTGGFFFCQYADMKIRDQF